MPHFGIMDEDALGVEKAALTRTKLHIRSAKRRLYDGKTAHGIATYWDAVIYGLRWYYYINHHDVDIENKVDIYYPEKLFPVLINSGILKTLFDFERWYKVADEAIDHPMSNYNADELIIEFQKLFTDLGIEPFDGSLLPDEMEGLY